MKFSRIFLPALVVFLSLSLFTGISKAGGAQTGFAVDATATPTVESATGPTPTPTAIPADLEAAHQGGADSCQMCHGHKQLKGVARNLDAIELSMNPADFQGSVHSKAGLTCTSCHASKSQYPHTDVQQVTCVECHGGVSPPYRCACRCRCCCRTTANAI
jgi:hypothetical protein